MYLNKIMPEGFPVGAQLIAPRGPRLGGARSIAPRGPRLGGAQSIAPLHYFCLPTKCHRCIVTETQRER